MPATRNARLPRGTVTFLFTDIEGSTRLLTALGDGFGSVLDAHLTLIRAAITGHAGIEVSTEGDAVFAVFASALDAVQATADAQRGLASHTWPDGAPVRVRMGLHTGEGRFGGDNYVGIDVNRAARIADAGSGGQVLLSEATRALAASHLPSELELRDLGNHQLKDLPAQNTSGSSRSRVSRACFRPSGPSTLDPTTCQSRRPRSSVARLNSQPSPSWWPAGRCSR